MWGNDPAPAAPGMTTMGVTGRRGNLAERPCPRRDCLCLMLAYQLEVLSCQKSMQLSQLGGFLLQ